MVNVSDSSNHRNPLSLAVSIDLKTFTSLPEHNVLDQETSQAIPTTADHCYASTRPCFHPPRYDFIRGSPIVCRQPRFCCIEDTEHGSSLQESPIPSTCDTPPMEHIDLSCHRNWSRTEPKQWLRIDKGPASPSVTNQRNNVPASSSTMATNYLRGISGLP